MKILLIIILEYLILFSSGCAILYNKPQDDVYYITKNCNSPDNQHNIASLQ